MAKKISTLDLVTWILGIIGGLNWGLIGFFNYNLVQTLFGAGTPIARVIYDVVGLSALYSLWCLIQTTKK